MFRSHEPRYEKLQARHLMSKWLRYWLIPVILLIATLALYLIANSTPNSMTRLRSAGVLPVAGGAAEANASTKANPAAVAAIRSHERSLARLAILDEVNRESLAESVDAIKRSYFSPLFTPEINDPAWNIRPSSPLTWANAVTKDPRIDKVLKTAESGTELERLELAALLEDEWRNYGFGTDYRPKGFHSVVGGSPSMGLPLLFAALDRNGEYLGILIEMAEHYIHEEPMFSGESPLASGNGPLDNFVPVLAYATEIVLANIDTNKSESATHEEYISMRSELSEVARIKKDSGTVATPESQETSWDDQPMDYAIPILESWQYSPIEDIVERLPVWYEPIVIEGSVIFAGETSFQTLDQIKLEWFVMATASRIEEEIRGGS